MLPQRQSVAYEQQEGSVNKIEIIFIVFLMWMERTPDKV